MFSLTDTIIFGVGAFILAFWLFLFVKGLGKSSFYDNLNEKDFRLKEVYIVGDSFMELIHYNYKSKRDRKLRKEISVIYSEKYADYYIRVVYAQKVTLASIVAILAFIMYGFTNSIGVLIVMLMFAGVTYYYFSTTIKKRILKRSDEMLRDFSDVVSKLALLTNAGMILREAWEEIAYTGETNIYKEMQKSIEEMNNGVSEINAIYNFGSRCIIPEIKKFTSTIIQGLVKGNRELVIMLQEQSKEVWAAKKANVKRQGEKAASKLLIPMMIMFLGILIMILVPVFSNIGK